MSMPFSDIRKQVDTLQVAERFFDSLLLFALFELGVFRHLADGPRTLDELTSDTDGDRETLRALLDGAVALEILTLDGETYAAPEAYLACLGRDDSPAYLGEWITFLGALVSPIGQLAEAVRNGRPAGSMIEGTEQRDDRPAKAMTRAMDAYARTRGVELAWRLDVSGVRTLLDVGCGPGTYSLAMLERHPELRATLLDLPGPIEVARGVVAERGLADRVTLAAADALSYVPEQAPELVLVSNILHMLGPETSQRLLAHCAEIVAPGGRIAVQAEFLDASRTSPRWPTLLNLIMQATTEGGRNHAVDETSQWLLDAGFVDIEHMRLSPWNVNSVLIAHRPPEADNPPA